MKEPNNLIRPWNLLAGRFRVCSAPSRERVLPDPWKECVPHSAYCYWTPAPEYTECPESLNLAPSTTSDQRETTTDGMDAKLSAILMQTVLPQPRSASPEGSVGTASTGGPQGRREPAAVTRPDATTTHTHAHLQADVQNPCSWDEADTPPNLSRRLETQAAPQSLPQ